MKCGVGFGEVSTRPALAAGLSGSAMFSGLSATSAVKIPVDGRIVPRGAPYNKTKVCADFARLLACPPEGWGSEVLWTAGVYG